MELGIWGLGLGTCSAQTAGIFGSTNLSLNTTGVKANASSIFDISSTTKGFLIPRMTAVQIAAMNPLPAAAQGLLVYQTDGTQGFYYNTSITTTPSWVLIASAGGSGTNWTTTGNTGTIDGTNFIGTTDNIPFNITVNNFNAARISSGDNLFLGFLAGANSNVAVIDNIAIGDSALYTQSFGTAFSSRNVAVGNSALFLNNPTASFIGYENTAVGNWALRNNTTGYYNTATGHGALYSNSTGYSNTAIGFEALYTNVAGINATAIGTSAMLYANNTATVFTNYNVALGFEALRGSTTASSNTGNYNTALGYLALGRNTNSSYNTAIGLEALYSNTATSGNIALGDSALYTQSFSTTPFSSGNVAIGNSALFLSNPTLTTNGNNNTAIGNWAMRDNTTGNSNTALGFAAGLAGTAITTGTFNTFLGYNASSNLATRTNSIAIASNGNLAFTGDNNVRIGNASMISIGGQDSWTTLSDMRTKTNVQENVPGLTFIKQLRPVTYHYDTDKENELMWGKRDTVDYPSKKDIEKIQFSGFLAQEVEAAASKIGYSFSGVDKPQDKGGLYGLRYAEFVVPLVKAVQELSKENEELKAEVRSQKSEIRSQKLAIQKLETSNQQQVTSNQQLLKEIERIKQYLELKTEKK